MPDETPSRISTTNVAEQLKRCRQRRRVHRSSSVLEQGVELVERRLVEHLDQRLGEIAEQVVEAEAGTWKRIDPVVFQQCAEAEPEHKAHDGPGVYTLRTKADGPVGRVDRNDHLDQHHDRNEAEQRHTYAGEHASVLSREVAEVLRKD